MDHIKNSPNVIADKYVGPTKRPSAHELRLSEPNEIGQHSPWDIDFRQIEPGEMETRLILRSSRDLTLMEAHMARGVHQIGCSPNNAVTLALPLTPAIRSWHGTELDTPGIIYFGTGMEFEGVSGPGFAALTLSICESFLTRVADQIGLPLQDEFEGRTSRPLSRQSGPTRQLAHAGRRLLYGQGTMFSTWEQEDFVAELVSVAVASEKFDDWSPLSTRAKSVRRAIDFLNQRAADTVSISEICAETGTSWRTLNRGFREQFGIGPKAYLNRFRLGQARSELLRARADTTVADAANAWGFWHMGQFAKDYRRMFGELPSETLKESR